MNRWIKVKRIFFVTAKYFLLAFASFLSVVPLVVCVTTSLKSDTEWMNSSKMALPQNWLNFENYITAWRDVNMGLAFRNSAIILVFVLIGSILFSSMLAYVLNRFRFRGNNLIRNLFLFATLIPGVPGHVSNDL